MADFKTKGVGGGGEVETTQNFLPFEKSTFCANKANAQVCQLESRNFKVQSDALPCTGAITF